MGDCPHQEHHVAHVQGEAAEGRAGESVPAHLDHSEEEQPDLDRVGGAPGKVVESVVVPHVELVVQTAGEHHSDKVAHEQR